MWGVVSCSRVLILFILPWLLVLLPVANSSALSRKLPVLSVIPASSWKTLELKPRKEGNKGESDILNLQKATRKYLHRYPRVVTRFLYEKSPFTAGGVRAARQGETGTANQESLHLPLETEDDSFSFESLQFLSNAIRKRYCSLKIEEATKSNSGAEGSGTGTRSRRRNSSQQRENSGAHNLKDSTSSPNLSTKGEKAAKQEIGRADIQSDRHKSRPSEHEKSLNLSEETIRSAPEEKGTPDHTIFFDFSSNFGTGGRGFFTANLSVDEWIENVAPVVLAVFLSDTIEVHTTYWDVLNANLFVSKSWRYLLNAIELLRRVRDKAETDLLGKKKHLGFIQSYFLGWRLADPPSTTSKIKHNEEKFSQKEGISPIKNINFIVHLSESDQLAEFYSEKSLNLPTDNSEQNEITSLILKEFKDAISAHNFSISLSGNNAKITKKDMEEFALSVKYSNEPWEATLGVPSQSKLVGSAVQSLSSRLQLLEKNLLRLLKPFKEGKLIDTKIFPNLDDIKDSERCYRVANRLFSRHLEEVKKLPESFQFGLDLEKFASTCENLFDKVLKAYDEEVFEIKDRAGCKECREHLILLMLNDLKQRHEIQIHKLRFEVLKSFRDAVSKVTLDKDVRQSIQKLVKAADGQFLASAKLLKPVCHTLKEKMGSWFDESVIRDDLQFSLRELSNSILEFAALNGFGVQESNPLRKKISLAFHYLSPGAFGLSKLWRSNGISDLRIDGERDVMLTSVDPKFSDKIKEVLPYGVKSDIKVH